MTCPDIKDLFSKTRVVGRWNLFCVALYFPFGLIVALIRVFISLQALLLAHLLLIPELSTIRRYVLRVMGLVLGIFVLEENPPARDKNTRLLVANHISIVDHIPIHLVTGCFSPSQWEVWPLCLKVFEGSPDKHTLASNLKLHLQQTTKVPLLLLPEETTTSGSCALLRFSPLCANVAASVQPVCLKAWRPFHITTTTLAASFSTDLFWFLFSPVTVFRIRYLPVIHRLENETDEEMADRIALAVAKDLGIVTTKFSAKDKQEYEKRYLVEVSRSKTSQQTARVSYELQRMASQVAEVLPYVPYEAIIRDLSRTRSVDLTISNILEGSVRFTPVPPEQRASTSRSAPAAGSWSEGSSSSFPRSAQDRMMSFVERKARLIEEARKRYMEKHGLVDSQ
ncbi:lipid droplet-regulating VLDL assembly factor AUP1-like [Macrosteles quadrilineatus]|uniref:lipid droplet-regulating VLDL assembly factor AUP1-like n=1 Tax=Macrosteles quadrilineatus TaxID=74068 RepID=UPI0023E298F1|nr:lipid droplet-regulating VLDL assembly factor AUP1-like [Macrosteles quadrilineatus]